MSAFVSSDKISLKRQPDVITLNNLWLLFRTGDDEADGRFCRIAAKLERSNGKCRCNRDWLNEFPDTGADAGGGGVIQSYITTHTLPVGEKQNLCLTFSS